MLDRKSITGVFKGIHNRRFYHFFLIVFAFVVLTGLSNMPAVAGQDVPNAYSALMAKAQTDGTVRIIVKLDRSSRPEGLLSGPQAVNEQRVRISGLQNQVHRAVSRYHVRGIKKFRHIPFQAMEVDADALASLIDNPLVVSIEEDVPVRPSLTESIPLIRADQAWDSGYSGAGWTVAILDTGVDKTHSMLAGKVVAEACFSTTNASATEPSTTLCPNGTDQQIGSGAGVNCNTNINQCYHGTHVAGIAAGRSKEVNGVAKDANIISIQVNSNFEGKARSYASDQLRALEHVYSLRNTYKIAAVNMSLGSGEHTSYCDSDSRKAAIDNLRSAGIATVISSGNDSYSNAIASPACISTAVSVGATDAYDVEASYGNSHSSMLSLFAPGSSILSAAPGEKWWNLSGTSMAAPHVTGAWAILKQKSPSASVADILNNLQSTGTAITTRAGSLFSGKAKRIDILAALNLIDALSTPTDLSATASPESVSGSASSENEVTLTWIDNSEGETGFRIERKIGANGTYVLIQTTAANVTSYVDSGLSGGNTYYYRVSAFKSANDIPLNSEYSNVASATIYTVQVDTPSPAVDAGGGGGGGGCFIATAAFGTPMEKHVSILRHFRDSILLKTSAGRAFVRFYYDVSPLIAGKIAQNEGWRFLTRCSLMPFVGMAYLMVSYGAMATLLFVLCFILMTGALAVVIRRRIAVFNR